MSLLLGPLNFFLRHVEKRKLRLASDIPKFRRRFGRQARHLFATPPYATFLADELSDGQNAVPALWAVAGVPKRNGVILYFHGGAYVFGAPDTHRALLARLSQLTGMRAVLPAYRKCPEHPFPAAPQDALVSYRALLGRGYRPDEIVFGGDSAGGGLMLVLLHLIKAENLPQPAVAFSFSPWTDLTLSGETIKTNAAADPFLPAARTKQSRDRYLSGADATDPRASPLFGSFKAGTDVFIQVGDSEILLDDSRRMADVMRSQGLEVRLDIWAKVPHVWQIFQGWLGEADAALADVAAYIVQKLDQRSSV